VAVAIGICGLNNTQSAWFLPGYCLLGVGLGTIYPTLIGWLNQDQDAHANRRGVSRTLILFCVSWNVGMMCGQLTSGSLFSIGPAWAYGVAFFTAVVNIGLAVLAAQLVTQSFRGENGDLVPRSSPDSLSETDNLSRAVAGRFQRLSWIANLGGTFGGSLIFHLLPDLAVSIGVPADDHGGLLAYWRGVVIVTYLLMHSLEFWHFRLSVSIAAQVLGVAGLLLIAVAQSSAVLFIGLTLHGQLIGFNYFSGLFYSTAGSSQDRRTLAAGIHEATLAVGMSSGTILGGALGTAIGPAAPWFLAAAVLLMLVSIQLVASWRWRVALRGETVPNYNQLQ